MSIASYISSGQHGQDDAVVGSNPGPMVRLPSLHHLSFSPFRLVQYANSYHALVTTITVAPVMFPGNRILFIELLTNPRWEDWDYEYGYAGNRFGYWGNGFTMRELDGRDTTFYYGLLEDHVDEQPDYEDVRALYATNG